MDVQRSSADGHEISDLVKDVGRRGRPAVDRLFPILLSGAQAHRPATAPPERWDHTLNTTGLVHEAYVKLLGLDRMTWQNRAHFLAVAAQAMRRVLVDYAVAKQAQKRDGHRQRVSLDEAMLQVERPVEELIAIDAQLTRLEGLNPRLARVVECRFFSGMSIEETALALSSSPATVKRDWRLARSLAASRARPRRPPLTPPAA